MIRAFILGVLLTAGCATTQATGASDASKTMATVVQLREQVSVASGLVELLCGAYGKSSEICRALETGVVGVQTALANADVVIGRFAETGVDFGSVAVAIEAVTRALDAMDAATSRAKFLGGGRAQVDQPVAVDGSGVAPAGEGGGTSPPGPPE